jgi:hypothetical protein
VCNHTSWRRLSSRLLHHVAWEKFTGVSEVLVACVIRVIIHSCPDDGGSKHFWNIGKIPLGYTVRQPRRHWSSYSSSQEPQISHDLLLPDRAEEGLPQTCGLIHCLQFFFLVYRYISCVTMTEWHEYENLEHHCWELH